MLGMVHPLFAMAAAAGGGSPYAAFNPATKGANISLSNSDRTATKSGSDLTGAKTAYGKNSGKHYFEVVLTTRQTSSEVVGTLGLARVDQGFEAIGWSGLGALVYIDQVGSGPMWVDSISVIDLGTPGAGDVYQFAVDLDAAKVWVRRNAGTWNGTAGHDPATNTGGYSLGDMSGYAVSPFVTAKSNGTVFDLRTDPALFGYSAPSGFTAGWASSSPVDNSSLGQSTLLSNKKTSNLTLSNGNLTATRNASGRGLAVSKDPKSKGKHYLEFTIGTTSASGDGWGLCQTNASANDVSGTGTKCFAVFPDGSVYVNGSAAGNIGTTLANGDKVRCAVDFDNGKGWFAKNGGNWNNSGTADPATNTGGITLLNRGLAPCIAFGNTASAANSTINLGASAFTYSVPTGFDSAWDKGDDF